ncbi:MAG: threonine--tRNA ligase [Thermoguttaceae bacterium]|nr:threonine--tRNA ligase [Thermoguttaceae bacterium]MDW8037677.1 threonine--tRNA ligase [Thermoguttaceae bacterium]
MNLRVRLSDGKVLEFSGPVQVKDVAERVGSDQARSALVAELDGQLVGLDAWLPESGEVQVRFFGPPAPEALEVMRHSCAHVMARAVMRLFEGVQLGFGPTVENGFYYDFGLPSPISEEDLPRIEAEMARIIQQDEPFERFEESHHRAIALCQELGQSLKVEHLQEGLAGEQKVSFYRQGEFIDLCRGPHVPSAGRIGPFKLLSVAGAYWKGDASRQQLQRIYGTAWFTQEQLDQYLRQLEEAKRRDHRVVGRRLELFMIEPAVGSGLVFWLPKGAIIRRELENFIYGELLRRGYQPVYTPVLGRVQLYETSGHYPYYADSQFPPIQMADGERFLLRPMNCPHHIMIYKSKPRSYRDLPLRLAEFGLVHRFEQSGELTGMIRVRGFTQDDAHIFCTEDQVAEEFRGCVEMTQYVFRTLGLENYYVRLGLRDPKSRKYVGSEAVWQRAEEALRSVCEQMNLPDLQLGIGEAAFYGPKADFIVHDCLGRPWQLGTVQLDYNLPSPERFGLQYIGPDNQPHQPVMIHRAPLGSFERFVGMLIEHFGGAFPLWLAPEQVRVIIVSQKFESYGREVLAKLQSAGIRATGDWRPEKINAKIREAQLEMVPYMFIVGSREAEQGSVSVRDRIQGDLGPMSLQTAIDKLQQEIAQKLYRKSPTG